LLVNIVVKTLKQHQAKLRLARSFALGIVLAKVDPKNNWLFVNNVAKTMRYLLALLKAQGIVLLVVIIKLKQNLRNILFVSNVVKNLQLNPVRLLRVESFVPKAVHL